MVYTYKHDRDCKEVAWFIPVDVRHRLQGTDMISKEIRQTDGKVIA